MFRRFAGPVLRCTLIQMATDASAFAIMGGGATLVIIPRSIDLSVGAIYALAGGLRLFTCTLRTDVDPKFIALPQ